MQHYYRLTTTVDRQLHIYVDIKLSSLCFAGFRVDGDLYSTMLEMREFISSRFGGFK